MRCDVCDTPMLIISTENQHHPKKAKQRCIWTAFCQLLFLCVLVLRLMGELASEHRCQENQRGPSWLGLDSRETDAALREACIARRDFRISDLTVNIYGWETCMLWLFGMGFGYATRTRIGNKDYGIWHAIRFSNCLCQAPGSPSYTPVCGLPRQRIRRDCEGV